MNRFAWREGGTVVDPYAWIPVFLFELPGSGSTTEIWTTTDQGVNPYGIALPGDWNFYLFDTYALEQASPGLFGGATMTEIARRWPLAERTAFYVSCNPNETMANPSADDWPWPEVVFRWDANDGLENGIYDVYVVTAEPMDSLFDIRDRSSANIDPDTPADENAPLGSPDRVDLLANPTATFKTVSDVLKKNNKATNPDKNRLLDRVRRSNQQDYSRLATDVTVFTDRDDDGRLAVTETWNKAASTPYESPDSCGEMKRAIPNFEGVIHYQTPVTVKNNSLALRLRNRAKPGEWNRFSRVVLVARRDNPGTINLNTVQTKMVASTTSAGMKDLFNPLYGVPGVLAYLDGSDPKNMMYKLPGVNEAVGLPAAPPPTTASGRLDPPDLSGNESERTVNIKNSMYWRAQRIVAGRPEWRDGRYYRQVTDLIRDRLTEHLEGGDKLAWNRVSPLQAAPWHSARINYDTVLDNPGFYDSLDLADNMRANQALTFEPDRTDVDNMSEEVAWRFARMANLVTTRSDVFEIVVLAQAGYMADTNSDGQLNYRDDAEFVVTAEKKTRAVYER